MSSQLNLRQTETSRNLNNNHEESFVELVCFGSKEVEKNITLGKDLHITNLSILTKQKLSSLLDPIDSMGRDWCMLAVRLGMTDKLPKLDTGKLAFPRYLFFHDTHSRKRFTVTTGECVGSIHIAQSIG